MTKEEILKWVKEDLIFKRLKLADIGITLKDINDDTQIFSTEELGLDSVDGLELAVGIQQKFDVKIPLATTEKLAPHFYTPNTITDFILQLLKEQKGK